MAWQGDDTARKALEAPTAAQADREAPKPTTPHVGFYGQFWRIL